MYYNKLQICNTKINNETPGPLGLYVTANAIITYIHVLRIAFFIQ